MEMIFMRKLVFFSIVATIALSGCVAFQTGLSTSDYVGATTALDKCRTYEHGFEQVFKAAFNAARKAGLRIKVADKGMKAIRAEKHIGAYTSGWRDAYSIFFKEEGKNTLVQVKYAPVREGLPFSSLSVQQTVQYASSAGVNWQSASMKVNQIFENIQKELGIRDILGVRGLLEKF